MTGLIELTLAEAREGLQQKKFSAVELAHAHIDAIEKARALNAFIVETPERALAMARQSDARIAEGDAGPLEGIPLGIKDLYCTEGVQTTAGSHILEGFVPPYESTVTANLWRDGAVMLGKLNLDEFAMGSSNETSYFGPVISPWRFMGWLGGGGRRTALFRCDGDRHRRLDPPARGFYRNRWHQADLWALLALRHRRLRVLARSGRPHCAHSG
jgi:Asp-tRNA(Asn)/Glu-tRNA(Gln) amidotransferase A subunit family amidase